MEIQLSDHFDYRRLLRFTMPTMIMMVVTSVYGIVDGLFVSNCVGKTAFAGINLAWPVIMAMGAFGTMLGTGGSALIAKTLGEGKDKKANEYFSMLIWVILFIGIVTTIAGFIFMPEIAVLLGATEELIDATVTYGRILILANTFLMLQFSFQSFVVVAEKPKLGLYLTVGAGVANILGDFILVYVLRMGVFGAAIATSLSEITGGLVPLIIFSKENGSKLKITKPIMHWKALFLSCTNGASEMVNTISSSLVSMLYMRQLLKIAGANGVASFGVIMYVIFIFIGVMFGYSMGVAPVIGYHYGADNKDELKNLFRRSLLLLAGMGIMMFAAGQLLAKPFAYIYVSYDEALLEMTTEGMKLYCMSFLICGFNIFASSFFTSLNNGVVSAVISFARTLVLQALCILILPELFGLTGVWCSITVAEAGTLILSVIFFLTKSKKYGYM